MTRLRIKLCGFTRDDDVDALAGAEVDAAGFVLWPASPRAVSVARAEALAASALVVATGLSFLTLVLVTRWLGLAS